MSMTYEQIKQNAEEYADNMKEIRGELEWCATRDDYIAGAHSRDEEIGKLKKLYEEALHKYYEAECKLRNPWHKTNDDIPKEGVHYQMKDGEFLYGKPMLLHICEDDDDSGDDYKGYFDGKFWRYWDKPMSCDVVMGKVTHWMPIPELE